YLIEAAQYLSSDYAVVIAGTGPLTDDLKQQASDLMLQNVDFIGRISDEDKKCFLWASDIYAFPSISKNEAFGIALAEGLYCGLPAVTFTIEGSGVNWVNKDGVTGMEVHELDAKKYAQALMSVSKEKHGTAARNWVSENFTEEAIFENVRSFFV
nr:glycosyltransferase [Treponema sp.]